MLIDWYSRYLCSAGSQGLFAEWHRETEKQFLGPAPGVKHI